MDNTNKSSDNESIGTNAPDSVLLEVENQIATITINRPKRMNALRKKEFDGLIKYIKEADKDPNVHVIRIRSSGNRAFSGGLDLNMLQQMTPEDAPKLIQIASNLTSAVLRANKPVVNQVQGPAVAWGTILCLLADFVIAGENPKTFFSLPEIDLGLFPATGALTLALFKFGFNNVKKILMIPEKITLDKAEQLGLVTKRCSIDSLEQTTIEFCQNLANKPQGILIPIKALINNFQLGNLERYMKIETEAFELAMAGDLEKLDDFIRKIWKI